MVAFRLLQPHILRERHFVAPEAYAHKVAEQKQQPQHGKCYRHCRANTGFTAVSMTKT